jgi:hypothetical protein
MRILSNILIQSFPCISPHHASPQTTRTETPFLNIKSCCPPRPSLSLSLSLPDASSLPSSSSCSDPAPAPDLGSPPPPALSSAKPYRPRTIPKALPPPSPSPTSLYSSELVPPSQSHSGLAIPEKGSRSCSRLRHVLSPFHLADACLLD